MDTTKNIRASFKKLYGKIKSGKEISEEELRSEFVNCGILEADINALVYKLYGLNEDDIKVIDAFLRRF